MIIWFVAVGVMLGCGLSEIIWLAIDLLISPDQLSLLILLSSAAVLLLIAREMFSLARIFPTDVRNTDDERLRSIVMELSRRMRVDPPVVRVEDIAGALSSPWRKGFMILIPSSFLNLEEEELRAIIAHEMVHLKLDMDSRTAEILKPKFLKLSILSLLLNYLPLLVHLLSYSPLRSFYISLFGYLTSFFLLLLSLNIIIEPDVRTVAFREARADFIASLYAGGIWLKRALSKVYSVNCERMDQYRISEICSPKLGMRDLILPPVDRHPSPRERAFIADLADRMSSEGLRVSGVDERDLLRAFEAGRLDLALKALELVRRKGVISAGDLMEMRPEEIFSLLVLLDMRGLLKLNGI